MSEEADLMKLFAAELGKPQAPTPAVAQTLAADSTVVGGTPLRPEDEGEQDVLRLLGSGSMESIAGFKPIPNVSGGSLAMAYAISSGILKKIVYATFQACAGMRASDFRAVCLAMAQSTQPLNKGDPIDNLVPENVMDDILRDHSPADILHAMKQRANKKAMFVSPGAVGMYYLVAMSGHIVAKMPNYEDNTIHVTLANKETRVIPPVEQMDDAKVGELLSDMRMYLDGAFETTKMVTEWLVRLSLYLHPITVVGQNLKPMDAAMHEIYIRQFVHAPWKETREIRGKQEHVLIGAARTLTQLVNARASKYVFADGANKTQVFTSVLNAVAIGGVTLFNKLWELMGPFVDGGKQIFALPVEIDKVVWDQKPVPERLKMMADKGWTPVAALRLLDSYRAARRGPVLEKIAACVDQPGYNNDSRLAQQEKIARVFELTKLAEKGNEKRVCLGIDQGFTVPYLAQRGFAFFDKQSKELYGFPILQLDVNNSLRLGEALKGVGVVLSDVAEASSGNSGAGDNLQRCSYMLNELSFSNIVQQCVSNGVGLVALKSFLPNTHVAGAILPEAVKILISNYTVRVHRCGKLHNDEIYYVGERRAKAVPPASAEYVETLRALILDYGYICAQLEVGNRLIAYSLATGSVGPRWRMERGLLEVSWRHFKPEFRPVTPGEAALYRYTHGLSRTLTRGPSGGETTLPIFGANKDLHVVEGGQDTDANIALYKLFGMDADPSIVALQGLTKAAQVEHQPSAEAVDQKKNI